MQRQPTTEAAVAAIVRRLHAAAECRAEVVPCVAEVVADVVADDERGFVVDEIQRK